MSDATEEAKAAILPYCYPQDEDTPGLVLNMNDTWCWGSDAERMRKSLKGVVGKRLMYRDSQGGVARRS